MTVAVFTFVLLLGNALKEILPLLISGRVSIGIVARAIGLLVPFVWVFALPMAMLTATLLIFGRFSADQELTAVRASGISLLALVAPVLVLSLALCGFSAWINTYLGPSSRVAYKDLMFDLKAEFSQAQLPEARFIRDFKGTIFYVGKNRGGKLEDVIVFRLKDETNVMQTVRAARGSYQVDPTNQLINVSLYDGRLINLGQENTGIMAFEELPVEFNMAPKQNQKVKLREQTFNQLRVELNRVEHQLNMQPDANAALGPAEVKAVRAELKRLRRNVASPIRFELNRQIAFSMACFGFALVGIPLGIRVHRRETNVGIAIALVLVAIYYGMVLLASSLDTRPEYYPHLLVWIPNLVFQTAGAFMLWKANRGV